MKISVDMIVHLEQLIAGCAPRYCFFDVDMSEYGYIPIEKTTVSFVVPDGFNPVPAAIASLRAEQNKYRAEAQMKDNAFEDRIAKLSCLEYTPEASHG